MITAIEKFFDSHFGVGSELRSSEPSWRLAAALLLFEIARADGNLDPEEKDVIGKIVSDQFALGKEETAKLLSLAEEQILEAYDIYGFTSLLNKRWSENERIRLVEWMWQVIYADGHVDDREQHFMRKVLGVLDLPRHFATKLTHKLVQ